MIKIGNGRLWISLGLVLVLAVLAAGSAQAGLFDIFKRSKGKTETASKEYLVVFPFDQVVVKDLPEAFGQDVAASVKSLISDNSIYSAFLYTDRLPPIKREALPEEDIRAPFCEDPKKTSKLASLLATDFYLVGEVQEVLVDQVKKVSQVTLSANLYMMKNGESKLVKTFLVSGKSPNNTKASEIEELRALAAGDAVSKLVADLTKPSEPEKSETTTSATGETEAVDAESPAPAK